MAEPQILQEANASSQNDAPSQSATLPNPVTEGSAIHVIAHWYQPASEVCTFRDSQENEYTVLDTLLGTNNEVLVHAYAANAKAGVTTVEVDFAQGSARFPAIWAREIGPAGNSPLLGHAIAAAASTSESASASNASQPALLSAFGFVEAGSGAAIPAATSPLVQDVSSWNFSGAFGTLGTSAHQLLGTTGSQSAEFTTSALGDGSLFALLAIFSANPPGWVSLAEWNVSTALPENRQGHFVRWPITLASTQSLVSNGPKVSGPCGRVIEIYPLTVGTSGSFTVTDNGTPVFTISTADVVAGVPIPVGITCESDVTIASVPTGGEYGVKWDLYEAAFINEGNLGLFS